MPRVSEISSLLGVDFEGEDAIVEGVSTPEQSDENKLIFLSDRKMDGDYRAGLVVGSFRPIKVKYRAFIQFPDVRLAMAKVLPLFDWHKRPDGSISPKATIGEGVEIGEGSQIMDFAYIGNRVKIGRNVLIYPFVYVGDDVEIGDDTVIYPHVYIGERITIGNRVIIHSGARLGADGFGFYQSEEGWLKIPQIGKIVVEDDVEIGANTTIDRATIGETRIGRGTKLDNLVQIGHNVKVGQHNMIVAQVGIGGSTRMGDWVILAGQVGVADHMEVPDGVIATAKTGLAGRLKPRTVYSSAILGMERTRFLRIMAVFRKLPEIYEKIREILRDESR